MGKLVWNELGRYVSLTASAYAVWASFWGMFFRKFFWDFVGGILRDPGGIQPSPRARVFIAIIVKVPFIQIMSMIVGLLILALEWPLPPLKGTQLHRSIPLRVVLLSFQSSLVLLFYQGTNASLYSLIAATLYITALNRGENIGPPKEQRGTCAQA
ncbi:hypothetical protein SCLCIDRAFT_103023 [Scleroderma citrinum Foug A]|uniref:DUF7727 domain-containing protein n=1 Tax=Scleroderma citrinum Foug A TaxID=1036808 RepID=A0A0C3AXS9_9AGAM|nr:hypothetical protein SCLCIDRAFT_103023 [Scleroderma citrinum Foug A]